MHTDCQCSLSRDAFTTRMWCGSRLVQVGLTWSQQATTCSQERATLIRSCSSVGDSSSSCLTASPCLLLRSSAVKRGQGDAAAHNNVQFQSVQADAMLLYKDGHAQTYDSTPPSTNQVPVQFQWRRCVAHALATHCPNKYLLAALALPTACFAVEHRRVT
jgi:hypothetical protein